MFFLFYTIQLFNNMPNPIQKRCICGQSNIFPLCDGKHGIHEWQCKPTTLNFHPRLIISTPHYLSLAEQLAHQHDLVASHQHSDILHCEELIILHDNDDLRPIFAKAQNIQHSRRRIISIDTPKPTLFNSPHPTVHISLNSMPLHSFLEAASNAINTAISSDTRLPKHLFLSHAVADEYQLLPIIDRLRAQYGCTVFLCADTIPTGANWQAQIEQALQESDLLLVACSEAFNQSTFCAYEIGFARGLNIPIKPILIEETHPPAYLQHLNAPSVPRIQRAHPWLSYADALGQAIFQAILDIRPSST